MPRILLPLIFALLAAGSAHADLKGTYQLQKDKPLALSFRDSRHMLAAVGTDKRLLMKGDETWVMTLQGNNWLAIDANSAAGLLAALRKKHDADVPAGPMQLRSLNRTEQVAGYMGEVFELSDGSKRYEVVLTDHPDVLALTNAWRSIAARVAQNLEQRDIERLQQALAVIPQQGKGGLLRQGDSLKLTAIDKKVSAADFDLPAGTQKMQLPLSLPGAQ
ncbi:MAG: hypothetical protein ABW049_07030 [Spongiibacteraceae bacterium]